MSWGWFRNYSGAAFGSNTPHRPSTMGRRGYAGFIFFFCPARGRKRKSPTGKTAMVRPFQASPHGRGAERQRGGEGIPYFRALPYFHVILSAAESKDLTLTERKDSSSLALLRMTAGGGGVCRKGGGGSPLSHKCEHWCLLPRGGSLGCVADAAPSAKSSPWPSLHGHGRSFTDSPDLSVWPPIPSSCNSQNASAFFRQSRGNSSCPGTSD